MPTAMNAVTEMIQQNGATTSLEPLHDMLLSRHGENYCTVDGNVGEYVSQNNTNVQSSRISNYINNKNGSSTNNSKNTATTTVAAGATTTITLNNTNNNCNSNFANNNARTHSNNSNNFIDDNTIIYNEDTEPRPLQFPLILFGLWQPADCNLLCQVYHNLICPLIWLIVMFFLAGVHFFEHFTWGKVLNAIGTVCNLGAPFLITRFYFKYGKFDWVLGNVRRSCCDVASRKFQRLRHFYSCLSIVFWLLGVSSFYYVFFMPYFTTIYHYVFYFIGVFYSFGWWGVWLGIYGYVCSCHKLHIKDFIRSMKLLYGYSSRTKPAEEECISKLLKEFTELRTCLQQSQRDFSIIISFCVFYHVFDLTMFSIAYWSHDFPKYTIYQLITMVISDTTGVFLKLYPAAFVNQELREVVVTAGTFCSPDGNNGRVPAERLAFHQYLFLREQDLGMNILGVKITSQVTVSILATLSILGLAFLYYAVPLLADGAVPMEP